MPSYDKLDYDVEAGRAEVFLDRPEVLNAYDDDLLEELDACLDVAMADDDVEVIVLSGRGRAFCSGVDLDSVDDHAQTRQRFEAHRARVDSVYRRLHKGLTPTVAAVNGPAVGAGMGFALTCDLRLVAEDAVMRDHHLDAGLPPSVGAGWVLPRLVGSSTARELVLTSREIGPQEAVDCGLATEVVDTGDAVAAARRLADRLAAKPRPAMRGALDLMNESRSFEEYVRAASEWQWACKEGSDGATRPRRGSAERSDEHE